MKKCFYALMVMLMALVSVGFAACGDDDDEPKVPDIVGTWQLNQSKDWNVYYQFTKDGKFHYVWKAYTIVHYDLIPAVIVRHGTYTVSGTKLIVTLDSGTDNIDLYLCPSECEYSVQGDSLKLLVEDEPTFTRVDDSVILRFL